jgi:SAM-dependent methyltransferase
LPFADSSIACIYGSHIFEHIDIFHAPLVFSECHRILKDGGFFRIVLPDVKKSIKEYLKGNSNYPLFKRRVDSLKRLLNVQEVSIFEALKGDFISPSGQPDIFGKHILAHQNAWDFEALKLELSRAGFNKKRVKLMKFKKSGSSDFAFEGTYQSEANESYRSIYVEVVK